MGFDFRKLIAMVAKCSREAKNNRPFLKAKRTVSHEMEKDPELAHAKKKCESVSRCFWFLHGGIV